MFIPPKEANWTSCESYYQNPVLELPRFLVFYAISQCQLELDGGLGSAGGYGVDLFITAVATEYFKDAPQIIVMYDEHWDVSEMLMKLESQTQKSFVTYYIPLNQKLARLQNLNTKPPDHIMHRLLPKAKAFIIFVKDENGFMNMLEKTSEYPWWTKRARLLILVKEKAFEPTKGILELLEKENILNGVVVTEFVIKDNSTGLLLGNVTLSGNATTTSNDNGVQLNELQNGVELQIVALDPYPPPGHSKQSFVARWKNTDFTAMNRPIFQEKIDNLRGNKLIACVFDFPPLVIKKEISPGNFTYSGQEVQLFDEFAKLLNFTYDFYEPQKGERWGIDYGNKSWTGLIGETQRNADFGFASIFLLDNRERVVDISNPYDQDQGCFATPRPEALQNWLGLILPFSWQVWACILAMAFVAGPIFSMITRPLHMDQSMTVGRGIFYALGSLVSTQKPPHAKSSALRTFIICWLIFCWLSFILYRVSLIVSLTTGPASYKIDTIKQLVRSGLKWGGFKEVLKTFTNTSDREDIKLFDRFREITNITEALDRVAEKANFAVLDSGKFLEYKAKGFYFDGYSSAIHITKECPTRYNVGFAMPIGSPFLDRFNELIRRLQSAGLIDKWLRDILHEAAITTPNKSKKRKHSRSLSLNDMKLCYIILFSGHFCAFVAFSVESLWESYTKRKADLLRLIRKLSVISVGMTPSVIITEDTDHEDQESLPPDDNTIKNNETAGICVTRDPEVRRRRSSMSLGDPNLTDKVQRLVAPTLENNRPSEEGEE